MRRINAYVLAADPTWIEWSVGAYYPHVREIVVSYDRSGRGWTGASVPTEECLTRLKALDHDHKMRFVPGDFSAPVADPMQNDTLQRNVALELASEGADWVMQLDTDEFLPRPEALLEAITRADAVGLDAVEMPMRVLYRAVNRQCALEVCSTDGMDHFEYIAPAAVRAGSRLLHSRQTRGGFLRAVVEGDSKSLQLTRPAGPGEVREEFLYSEEAVIHNSWARSPLELVGKLASWSHSSTRAWCHYLLRWMPAPLLWRYQRNLHPFFGSLWPALRICPLPLPSLERSPVLAKNLQRSSDARPTLSSCAIQSYIRS
jgi:hypothetical protein